MAEEQISFEQAMDKLSALSQKLEKGEISLDEAMDLYKEAMELAKICNTKLTATEQTVKLISENDDGSVDVKNFNGTDEQIY